MDDLKNRINDFFYEIEFTELKEKWVEKLIDLGISKKEASVWAAEIGHVVDEYRSTLMDLADLLGETDTERIPKWIYSWAVGISEVTVSEIEEPMRYLEKQLEKYLPPEPDDEE